MKHIDMQMCFRNILNLNSKQGQTDHRSEVIGEGVRQRKTMINMEERNRKEIIP